MVLPAPGTVLSPGQGIQGEGRTWSFIRGQKGSFLPAASTSLLWDSGFLKSDEVKASLRKSAGGLLHALPNLMETIPESLLVNITRCMQAS